MLNYFLKAKNKKGFTIIEMVVVIAIIGILTATLLPNFSSSISSAESTAKAANLASVNKIAATAQLSEGNGPMLDVTAAVVSNFGKETASASLSKAVFDSKTKTFTAVNKVKVENKAAPDRNLYYPVSGENADEIAACLKDYRFVTYDSNKQNLSTSISSKIANKELKDLSGKFTEVYVINGSLALQNDVEMADTLFIFLDGASLETNGNSFKCHSVAFVDTSADGKTPVTFNVYGGNVLPEYSFGVLNVKNFYKDDGSINWSANGEFSEKTAITLNFGGTMYLNAPDYSGVYLNVDSACANIWGVIALPNGGVIYLDGDTTVVVEDGGTILPAQTQAHDMSDETTSVSVKLKSGTDEVQVILKDGSFISMTVNGEHSVLFDGVSVGNGITQSTISPLTAEYAANYLAQVTQAIISAGGNVNAAMDIVEKTGNAIVGTAVNIAQAVQAGAIEGITNANTAQALISSSELGSIVNSINAMKTNVVSGAIMSATNSASAVVASAVGTVTQVSATGASGVSIVSTIAEAQDTCDTSWYIGHEKDTSYTITKPSQLYGLSSLVFNGATSFYGKTITLANDISLDNYHPWLPIGNGQYGFRGTLDGGGHKITNMHLEANKSWVMLSMSGKGWNNTALRATSEREGTYFGYQNGDKYGVGFIGVLENGGELKNVTFENCSVVFDYNWNSYAAVAVGAIRATGEDYSYNGFGYENKGKVITGMSGGIAQYDTVSGTTGGYSAYAASGQKWDGSTIAEQNSNRLNGTQSVSYDYRDRAFDGWTTKITNVTVASSCSVMATGRCGGLCAVVAGAYYSGGGYNEARAKNDSESIFAGWGDVVISNCSNGANVTHIPTQGAYEEGGGILGYAQVTKHIDLTISGCSNTGTIKAGAAAGILGNQNYLTSLTISGCSNSGTIQTVDKNRNGKVLHSSTVASSIYNINTSTAGNKFDNTKLS